LGLVDFLVAAEVVIRQQIIDALEEEEEGEEEEGEEEEGEEEEGEEEQKSLKVKLREAIQLGIDTIQKEIDKLLAKVAGYRASIVGLESKIEDLLAELNVITDAISLIDSYLAEFPCPELQPIRAILEFVRAFIAAQIALVDVAGLSALLDVALSQLNALTVASECLDKILAILE
jgi:hypothetical protein